MDLTTRLRGITLTVSSLEQSVDWYSRTIGLAVSHRRERTTAHGWVKSADMRGLGVPLTLTEYSSPGGPMPQGKNRPGACRISISVFDAAAWNRRLVHSGALVEGEPAERDGAISFTARDPNGTLLEFVQPVPAPNVRASSSRV